MLNAYELTEQGVGIAIYPAAAGAASRHRNICVKRIVKPEVTASYVMIWNKSRQLPSVAREFLEYVKKLPAVQSITAREVDEREERR